MSRLIRTDLIIIDLCRHRDYAEVPAIRSCWSRIRAVTPRHSYRLSRNARTFWLADSGLVSLMWVW